MTKKICYIVLLLISWHNYAQDSKDNWFHNHVAIGGYVKYLNILNFHDGDNLMTDNLWHNRINLSIDFNDKISFHSGLRNRVFYGDMLKLPGFNPDALSTDAGIVDATFLRSTKRKCLYKLLLIVFSSR